MGMLESKHISQERVLFTKKGACDAIKNWQHDDDERVFSLREKLITFKYFSESVRCAINAAFTHNP